MNKEELLRQINKLNLPKGEYYILGGGSLVLYGLKSTTGDLDLCVSYELFEILNKKFNIDLSQKNKCGFYPLNDFIEVVPNAKKDLNFKIINEYPVENLRTILAFKKQRRAPKDESIIPAIEEYLASNPEY